MTTIGGTAGQLLQLVASVRGLAVLVLLYTCAGALVMMSLENSQLPEKQRGLGPDQVDTNFLYKLYKIRTSKLISREQFAETSRKELVRWQQLRAQLQWDFNSAFLYCFTLHTTIGYGHVAPNTALGKWFSVLYAMCGIPLFLVFIGRLGAGTERWLRRQLLGNRQLAAALTPWLLPGNQLSTAEPLPLPLLVAAFAGYCCLAAPLFAITERWPAADCAYFSIISATSIGLGDLVPSQSSLLRLAASVAYLIGGINLCTIVLNRLNELLEASLPAEQQQQQQQQLEQEKNR